MKVRLTKKLAECIDGVELAGRRVGDIVDFAPHQARLLLAHEWAVAVESPPVETATEAPSEADSPAEPLTIRVRLPHDEQTSEAGTHDDGVFPAVQVGRAEKREN